MGGGDVKWDEGRVHAAMARFSWFLGVFGGGGLDVSRMTEVWMERVRKTGMGF